MRFFCEFDVVLWLRSRLRALSVCCVMSLLFWTRRHSSCDVCGCVVIVITVLCLSCFRLVMSRLRFSFAALCSFSTCLCSCLCLCAMFVVMLSMACVYHVLVEMVSLSKQYFSWRHWQMAFRDGSSKSNMACRDGLSKSNTILGSAANGPKTVSRKSVRGRVVIRDYLWL